MLVTPASSRSRHGSSQQTQNTPSRLALKIGITRANASNIKSADLQEELSKKQSYAAKKEFIKSLTPQMIKNLLEAYQKPSEKNNSNNCSFPINPEVPLISYDIHQIIQKHFNNDSGIQGILQSLDVAPALDEDTIRDTNETNKKTDNAALKADLDKPLTYFTNNQDNIDLLISRHLNRKENLTLTEQLQILYHHTILSHIPENMRTNDIKEKLESLNNIAVLIKPSDFKGLTDADSLGNAQKAFLSGMKKDPNQKINDKMLSFMAKHETQLAPLAQKLIKAQKEGNLAKINHLIKKLKTLDGFDELATALGQTLPGVGQFVATLACLGVLTPLVFLGVKGLASEQNEYIEHHGEATAEIEHFISHLANDGRKNSVNNAIKDIYADFNNRSQENVTNRNKPKGFFAKLTNKVAQNTVMPLNSRGMLQTIIKHVRKNEHLEWMEADQKQELIDLLIQQQAQKLGMEAAPYGVTAMTGMLGGMIAAMGTSASELMAADPQHIISASAQHTMEAVAHGLEIATGTIFIGAQAAMIAYGVKKAREGYLLRDKIDHEINAVNADGTLTATDKAYISQYLEKMKSLNDATHIRYGEATAISETLMAVGTGLGMGDMGTASIPLVGVGAVGTLVAAINRVAAGMKQGYATGGKGHDHDHDGDIIESLKEVITQTQTKSGIEKAENFVQGIIENNDGKKKSTCDHEHHHEEFNGIRLDLKDAQEKIKTAKVNSLVVKAHQRGFFSKIFKSKTVPTSKQVKTKFEKLKADLTPHGNHAMVGFSGLSRAIGLPFGGNSGLLPDEITAVKDAQLGTGSAIVNHYHNKATDLNDLEKKSGDYLDNILNRLLVHAPQAGDDALPTWTDGLAERIKSDPHMARILLPHIIQTNPEILRVLPQYKNESWKTLQGIVKNMGIYATKKLRKSKLVNDLFSELQNQNTSIDLPEAFNQDSFKRLLIKDIWKDKEDSLIAGVKTEKQAAKASRTSAMKGYTQTARWHAYDSQASASQA